MEALHLTILFFLSLTLAHSLSSNCDLPSQGPTLRVYHVSSPCSPFRPKNALSWEESVLQMQADDKTRLVYLTSLAVGRSFVPIASGRQIIQSPTYIVKVNIGTPAQSMLMALDTSTDMALIPSVGCVGCTSVMYDSAKSQSFSSLACGADQCKQVQTTSCLGTTCSLNMTYGGSTIAANLATDNVTLATDSVVGYSFGSIKNVAGGSFPPQGVLGLGRGPLSFVSQSKTLYKSTFSYCLPSFKSSNFSGTLRLGPIAQPIKINYTPLLVNPRRTSLYYVNLLGIKVGSKVVNIPPSALAFNPNTGGGTIIDSGTVFTRLIDGAYMAVRDEFRRRMGKAVVSSLGGFDTCYTVPITKQIPSMTFMFPGLNMSLPQDNFLIHSSSGSTTCLAMSSSPALNVIANMQQQNHRVLFDIPNSRLGISREICS
ncbi:eukaryotic aspartyl protease family protein [Artemisia annua]|uniref:Eukaryotic aspartyl protease family protein n=1 Tax=Artemisia annua TaxID=35608 RepID=A0A2U1P7C3_ARTAN|nr:eukaryotic aspartyl protease family protein [Artemisia annua]